VGHRVGGGNESPKTYRANILAAVFGRNSFRPRFYGGYTDSRNGGAIWLFWNYRGKYWVAALRVGKAERPRGAMAATRGPTMMQFMSQAVPTLLAKRSRYAFWEEKIYEQNIEPLDG